MPTMQPSSLPIPPPDLLRRIGPMGDENPAGVYEQTGRLHRKLLEDTLPDDWSWTGKRVLDFGCGVGRVLRQFAPEAEEAEFWGCDLDKPSLEWLRESLSPPFQIFESTETGGLPQADGYFDLIYAYSVYTHFTDNWSGWLMEHHRALADGGMLFATFLGEGMLESLTGEKWNEDQIGMNPLMHGYSWDLGGPIAINSPWWIRAHWGRAFDIVELVPRLENGAPSHGIVLARKKPGPISRDELTRLEPDEPRELRALNHHVEQLAAEASNLRAANDAVNAQVKKLQSIEKTLADVLASSSWRLTAPMRAARLRLGR
jgi:SAM-dependent methyltransferase